MLSQGLNSGRADRSTIWKSRQDNSLPGRLRCGTMAVCARASGVSGEKDGNAGGAAEGGEPDAIRGRHLFVRAVLLASGCWVVCILLQILLYARPAPYGGPFPAEWNRYFGLAVYYDLLGVWLVSFPFFLVGLGLYNRPLNGRFWRALAALHAVLLGSYLALSQIDHELLRFLGVRLNPSFLFAYAQPQMLSDTLFLDVLGSDRGGPFLSLILLDPGPVALCLVGHPPPAPAWKHGQDAGLVVGDPACPGSARGAGERLADGDQPVPAAQGRAGHPRLRHRHGGRL